MHKCKCGLAAAIGVCCCGAAIAADQLFEFKRPSDVACSSPPIYRDGDFGPPPGCSDGSLPHNRTVWITTVASSSSVSVSHTIFMSLPLVTTAKDAEDAAEATGPGFQVVAFGSRISPPDATAELANIPSPSFF